MATPRRGFPLELVHSALGSPPHPSPPRKQSRPASSSVTMRSLSSENEPSLASAPLAPSPAAVEPQLSSADAVATPAKGGYSRADLEDLVQLFTPLSLRKGPQRAHSEGPARRATAATLPLPAPPPPSAHHTLSAISALPHWLALTVCAHIGAGALTMDQLTPDILAGARACADLGPEEAACYLRARLPHCHWSTSTALSDGSAFADASSATPLLSIGVTKGTLGRELTPLTCSVKWGVTPRSTRLQRQFGAANCAVLTCSSPAARPVFLALISSGFTLCGREYAFACGKASNWTAWFVCGPVSPHSVRSWHIPYCAANAGMPPHKRAARLALCVSKTVPTLSLAFPGHAGITPVYVDDIIVAGIPGPRGCMTDGNAPMSERALQAVWASYRAQVAHATEPTVPDYPAGKGMYTPAAVQARVGEYKGVWVIHPDDAVAGHTGNWIGLRPSMCKFALPPAHRTASQAVFEVVRWSHDSGPACLNRQIIALLSGRGVPASAFLALAARAHAALRHGCSSAAAAVAACAYLPSSAGVHALVSAGMWDEPWVTRKLCRACEAALLALSSSAHIPVPTSRRLMIVSDPTGMLKEGEVFARLSAFTEADDTLRRNDGVVIGPVVLARNPCHASTDVQTFTGVDILGRVPESGSFGVESVSAPEDAVARCRWWRDRLVDVLVLPAVVVKGSPAHTLSGGDYDGDTVWLCWDEALIPPSFPTFAVAPQAETDVVFATASCTSAAASEEATEAQMVAAYKDSLCDNTLSVATNLHLAWLDALLSSPLSGGVAALSHPACATLASICADMVDAAKTGKSCAIPAELWNIPYPHYLRSTTRWSRGYRQSTSVLGQLHDAYAQAPPAVQCAVIPKPSPHPRVLRVAECVAEGWAVWKEAAAAELLRYNAELAAAMTLRGGRSTAVAEVQAASRCRLRACVTEGAQAREKSALPTTPADKVQWRCLLLACYMECVSAAISNGRCEPYRFAWDMLGADLTAMVTSEGLQRPAVDA